MSQGFPLWIKYKAQFGALQKREKYLTLFLGLFVLIYLSLWFFVFPQQEQVANIRAKQKTITQELQQTNTQLAMLNQAISYDYTKVLRTDITQTKQQLSTINTKLNQFSQGFIAAKKVPALLKDLLINTYDVQVVSFKVKPAKAIDVEALGENDARTLFFEHHMEVTLQGSYFSLQRYLSALKNNQNKLLIQGFNYQVQAYPLAKLTLQIATVSANEKFIAL